MDPDPVFLDFQEIQQTGNAQLTVVWGDKQRTVDGCDSPDPAVDLITPWVSKIYFPMLDNGTVPICHIESAIRPHDQVNGTKRDMTGFQKILIER